MNMNRHLGMLAAAIAAGGVVAGFGGQGTLAQAAPDNLLAKAAGTAIVQRSTERPGQS